MHTLPDVPFDELRRGAGFRTRGRTITEADVVGFASLTGDGHPQHVDAAWAQHSRFGRRIAHGLLVASYAIGLIGFDPDRVVALRRVRDVVFKRPVHIGDTVHVEGRVGHLTPVDDDIGLVTCDVRILNQDGRLVCRLCAEVLWRREAPDLEPQLAAPTAFVPIPL